MKRTNTNYDDEEEDADEGDVEDSELKKKSLGIIYTFWFEKA